MTLNVSNCPTGLALGKRIAQVLEWLCPSVDHLPMSLPVLNGPPFVPVKVKEDRGVVNDVMVTTYDNMAVTVTT